jgi:hypothetical protein
MNKCRWFFERWKLFSHPAEDFYRFCQQIQYNIVDRYRQKHHPVNKHFIFCNPFKDKYSLFGLKNILSKYINDYRSFKLLNITIPDILSHNKWNYDIKNNIMGRCDFIHNIKDFNYAQGEIKYISELSRLYHLPHLAAYGILDGNEQIISVLKKQLKEWYRDNPYLKSVAWKSGNVVGIRTINLIFFRIILDINNTDIETDFDSFFNELIELHFKFLISHFSLYSSKGNHYIGEIAGLVAICSAYQFKKSDEYLKKYFLELSSELLRLIYEDGFNKEQSTRYQASYINLFVTAFQFAWEKGCVLSEEGQKRLESMYLFLEKLKISNRQYFLMGDDDDAQLIYPYADKEYNIYESMLNDFGVLYNRHINKTYHFDLRNYLLFGDKGYSAYIELNKHDEPENSSIKIELCEQSGYFLINDENIKVLFDVGVIGLQPTMAHGHSDILSFSLYYKNSPVIVDMGSYQYNAHFKKLRDYFHGVHSHNTIAVNNDDQAVLGEGMFWLSNPKTKIESYSLNPDSAYCIASHNGYIRKNYQVLHKRKIDYKRNEEKLIITDYLSGQGKYKISFYLHFHPTIKLSLIDNTLMVCHESISIRITNEYFHLGQLYKGDGTLPSGWYSPSYDNIEETYTFILNMDIDGNCDMKTEILL